MKRISQMMSRLFVLGVLAGTAGFAFCLKAPATTPAKAASVSAPAAEEYTAADFAGEIEVEPDSLSASITASAVTDTSQSLTVKFESVTVTGFKTRFQNYFIQIDDEAFSGDPDNPVKEGFEDLVTIDEETKLPRFHEGKVTRIVGGSNKNARSVYIPETITREDSFICDIKTIASLCVVATPKSGEKEVKNAWARPSGQVKITDIYIPKTITTVENNAFTGVPAEGVTIHVDLDELPFGYDHSWTDAPESALDIRDGSFNSDNPIHVNPMTAGSPEKLTEGDNFFMGCQPTEGADSKYPEEKYNKPLVVEYETVKEDGTRTTHFQSLELINTVNANFDGVGNGIASSTYTRLLTYRLEKGESVDDSSFVFHNILKFYPEGEGPTDKINPDTLYYVAARINYSDKQKLSNLVSIKGSMNSTFAGYSMFTLKMSKNLSITSEQFPEPHSLYLDVKTEVYENNLVGIKAGTTKIRYSLYNLYNSSYHFVYKNKAGQLVDIVKPIKSVITYQILEQDKNNLVSVLLKNIDIAPDFSAERVKTFELQDINIQMDLLATSTTGSSSVLSKSAISYKFAYISVIDLDSNKNLSVFNWNVFLIIFVVAYLAVYAGLAYVLFRVLKEKFKNDEFRRVNNKRYTKKAILGGLGSAIVVLAAMFIYMRFAGFKNTIVVFNPTDPFVIGFAIIGAILFGYFIVLMVKAIKAEQERRRIIRLRLDEDEVDDGTN